MKGAAVGDYRELARRRLPHFLFEYLDGGSYDEITLRRNVEDLRDIALRQRVLRDVSAIDLKCKLFGQDFAMPIGLAPVGLAGMNARRGEVQAAKAAEAARTPFCLSTVSVCGMDEVAGALKRPFWFQLYMVRDRGYVREMLAKAKGLGCSALVFTVDLPTPGARYRDVRSGLTGAPGVSGSLKRAWHVMQRPEWAWDVGLNGGPHSLGNISSVMGADSSLRDFLGWINHNFDPSTTWRDLEFIRETWTGPLIIKGVLDPQDAVLAAELGADGIVVSNHGGRQLDGVLSTAKALPGIADAVGDRLTVLVDGGVRSGLDAVRLLALGAKGVLIGRAWAYALAAAGQTGVAHVLSLMAAEMRVAMALTGVTRVADLDRSSLA